MHLFQERSGRITRPDSDQEKIGSVGRKSEAPRQGLVQVYTGKGKGKTTAALGLALRASGRGLKVVFFQFMKPPESSGEHFMAQNLDHPFSIRPLGRRRWISKSGPEPTDIEMARQGLDQARKELGGGEIDILILDEVDLAIHLGLLKVEEILDLLERKPPQVEVVLTGRSSPRAIIERADLVTEMKELKHPFRRGIKARIGIEY